MCDRCEALLSENSQLTDEISGLLYTTRRQAASIAGLEGELRKVRQDSPQAQDVRFVLTRWKALTGHLRSKIDPEGDRWALAAKAVKRWGVEDCLDAVQGLALAPYMHYGRRRLAPCGKTGCCVRRDDIKDAFNTEVRFEDCLSIAKRANQAESERLWEAQRQVSAQSDLLTRKVMDALNREAMDKLLAESHPDVRAGKTPAAAVVYDLQQRRVA